MKHKAWKIIVNPSHNESIIYNNSQVNLEHIPYRPYSEPQNTS